MPAPTPSPSASGRSTDLPWVMAATCVKKSGAPLPKACSVAPATSSLRRSQAAKLPTAGAKNCSADSVSAANTTIWRRGTRVSALFGRKKRLERATHHPEKQREDGERLGAVLGNNLAVVQPQVCEAGSTRAAGAAAGD